MPHHHIINITTAENRSQIAATQPQHAMNYMHNCSAMHAVGGSANQVDSGQLTLQLCACAAMSIAGQLAAHHHHLRCIRGLHKTAQRSMSTKQNETAEFPPIYRPAIDKNAEHHTQSSSKKRNDKQARAVSEIKKTLRGFFFDNDRVGLSRSRVLSGAA